MKARVTVRDMRQKQNGLFTNIIKVSDILSRHSTIKQDAHGPHRSPE
jgi:hypothetical protein